MTKSKTPKLKQRDVIINSVDVPVLDISALPYDKWGKALIDDADAGGAYILFYACVEGRKKEWNLVGPF